jgi:hypothetical protein
MQFRVGSFCPSCFQERTEQRIIDVDEHMAGLVVTATTRVGEVLEIPVNALTPAAVLGPVLRAAEMVTTRFKRPERTDQNINVRSVAMVGSPVDFTQAREIQAAR